jgi:glycosyltransferase involved in cell wall biosynthesis
MHLGLIIYGSLDTMSGGFLYDRMMVEYLRRQGDDVKLISLPWRNYAAHLTDNFSASLLNSLKNASFDILLQDELNHPSLFWLNRQLHGIVSYPIVSIVHHLRSSELRPAWQNGLYRVPEASYLKSVDGFVFNSLTTRQSVESLAGSHRPSVVAFPAGDRYSEARIDGPKIHMRAFRDGPLRILFVGNLIPRKGLHTLLDALARLDPTRWRLTVVGSEEVDPGYARRIRAQIRRLKLEDSVALVGVQIGTQLADLYLNHQVLALPSSYEGYGIVYLEGMCFGMPAIGTTAGAAREIITEAINGFLVPTGDSVALAGAIQSLVVDRELLATMGQAARARYEVQPTWEQSMAGLREFLVTIAP